MITISLENVHGDDLQIAAKLFKVIQEFQPSVKERLGFGPSKTKKTKDFHSQLVDGITKKLIDYYNPGGKILWGISLDFPHGNKHVRLRQLIKKILQFEEEAADEIFGDE